MKKTNYHSHTTICKHSDHKVRDLIELAIKQKFEIFAISEHVDRPNNLWAPEKEELEKLINEVSQLKEEYKDRITLLMGLECEYSPVLDPKIRYWATRPEIDFLSFGNHYAGDMVDGNLVEFNEVSNEDLIKSYSRNQITAMKSGLFNSYNHPDLFLKSYFKWDEQAIKITEEIINLSLENDIPLEFNLNGLYHKNSVFFYPVENFWKMVAKTKVKVIVGVDTHSENTMSVKLWNQGQKLIKDWGLTNNLIDELKIKKHS
ncbi:MAG: PHP domain-containing protein [Mycoplasma sp.]